MKRTLVPDAHDWWRWGSTRVLILIAALPPAWASLPPDVKVFMPEEWRPFVFTILALAGVVVRVSQPTEER